MSDSESESVSTDPRDVDDGSELDDDVEDTSRSPQIPAVDARPEDSVEESDADVEQKDDASEKAGGSKKDDASEKDDASTKSDAEPEAVTPEYGLLYEYSESSWQTYDIVVVHGIRETPWSSKPGETGWRQGSGYKESAYWISSELGFNYGRFLHFQYEYQAPDDDRPDVLYQGGIERQAQKLIDDLLEIRQKFDKETEENDTTLAQSRGIVFVAHDIGGIIVKKALTLAALNPAKYGDIPYNTTNLIFLGCPHRGSRIDIQDQVARMLLLPENSFQDWIVESINVLSCAILQVNEEFLDTNVLLRASLYSIVNTGVGPDDDIPAPWRALRCFFSLPYEFIKYTRIPHMKLPLGDTAAEEDWEKFADPISKNLGRFPYFVDVSDDLAQIHKTFLSMAPPVVIPTSGEYGWQAYDWEPWILQRDQYKEWKKKDTLSILHIRGPIPMRLISEKLWEYLIYDAVDTDNPFNRNIAFFCFRRGDSRFNTVQNLLSAMIAHIISRSQDVAAIRPIFDMMNKQRAWTTRDLVQIFHSCQDSPSISPMTFMIACLDECDESFDIPLQLLAELNSISEKPFRFIFTTTSGANEQLEKQLAAYPTIDLADYPKAGTEWPFKFDTRYAFDVKRLLEKKPVYAHFQDALKEALKPFGPDDRLGDFILRWLVNCRQDNSRAGVKKTLAGFANLTFEKFMDMIVSTFGARASRARDLLSWVSFAFEPLTTFELGVGVELTQGTSEEDLEDIFFDVIQADVKQFSLAFPYREHDVQFWHWWSDRKPPTPEQAAAAHAELACQCLRYLSFPSVVNKVKELCDNFISLDETPLSRPRKDLVSYAVLYWPKHYALAGSQKPKEEALAFLDDPVSRNAWSSARYVLSNHMVRLHRGYLSPLPVAAMTGLDDLVAVQLETQKSSLTFATDAGLALVEAVRNGHGSTARLIVGVSKPAQDELRDAISAAAAVGDEATLNYVIELATKVKGFDWPPDLFSRIAWLDLVEIGRLLLDSGVKIPESTGTFESSVLHIAIEARHKGMVKLLLDNGCDVEAKDEAGYTPLTRAASQGCPDIVKMLLAAGADPEVTTEDGVKPVQRAIRNAKPKALRALLEGGAKTEVGVDEAADPIQDSTKANPLVLAAINGYTECVRALLDHGADVKALLDKRTALWHAASRGHIDACRLLLEKGADPNENPEDYDLVLVAVISSDLDREELMALVNLLIDHGARVDEQDAAGTTRSNPLSAAAGTGNEELVTLLLDKGAPPNLGAGITETPLYVAAYDGHEKILTLLIERGADLNIPGNWQWTPLHAAYDNEAIVKILLEKGADINMTSDTGTVTYIATKHNKIEVLRVLLAHTTPPDLEKQLVFKPDLGLEEYEDGMTPLCIACKNGFVDIMRLLLENHAKPDHSTADGSFPLEFCLDTNSSDRSAVMETLLEFRPKLTQSDNEGNTVLHNISRETPLAVVKVLYTAGADISAVNKAGKTPLTLAVETDNTEVAKFLIEKNEKKTDVINIYSPDTGTILNTVVARGGWEIFEAAVNNGADVHLAHRRGYRETLLYTAMDGYWGDDREKIVRYLLDVAKVDPNEKCNDELFCFPIIKAAYSLGEEALKILLDHGADPNVEDAQGRRAIHMAAYRFWYMSAPLIEKGAELLPRAKSGMTPLHFAAAGMNDLVDTYDKIREIVEGNGEVEGNAEVAPAAAGEEKTDAVSKKKKQKKKKNGGAAAKPKPKLNPNDKDEDGWTLLMWMAKSNYSYSEVATQIVERGGDLWVKAPVLDANGKDRDWSPLKAARYYGASEDSYEALVPKEKTRTLPNGRTETWNDEEHMTRQADFKSRWTCDHCLTYIVGLNWKCRECTFNLCYKCARVKHLVHQGHEFEAEGPEYEPLPSSTPERSNSPTEDAPTPFTTGDRHTESDDLSDDDDGDDDDDDDDDDDTVDNDSDA